VLNKKQKARANKHRCFSITKKYSAGSSLCFCISKYLEKTKEVTNVTSYNVNQTLMILKGIIKIPAISHRYFTK